MNRQITLYDCATDKDKYTPLKTIIQSGPEFIIINPEQSWGRNSFLVSKELAHTPTNWRFLGINTETSTWSGFRLEPNFIEDKPVTKQITFDTRTRELMIEYNQNDNGYKVDDIKVTCEKKGDIEKAKEAANNVSINYLRKRSSGIGILRPTLSNKAFNKMLYSDIGEKEHSEYGRYQLLKFLGNNQRNSEESSIFKSLEQTLINKNSRSVNGWEFLGTYRYWWERQYPNEKSEADKNAGNWCRGQQDGSKDRYLNQGYKLISDNPEKKSTYGWEKQTYEDGRFAGYVKYKAECDGKSYTLKRDGSVDDHSENTYEGGS